MEYYWKLTQHDGTVTDIPPAVVPIVKRRMTDGQAINLKTMSIPANQIKSFRISERPFTETLLLEESAGVFGEPLINPDGTMVYKWVKKGVPQDKWNKFYSPNAAYKKLAEENSMVIIAFKLPVHSINQLITPYCTDEEINRLNKSY